MSIDLKNSPVPQWKLIGGFVAVCLIWGSSWAAVRVNVQTMPPAFSSGLRFLIATILLAGLAWIKGERLPRDRTFWLLSAYLMVTAVTVPFGLVYWGQQRVDSGIASVLFGIFPLWVALLAHFALRQERVSLLKGVGILAGFSGIAIVSRATSAFPEIDLSWAMLAILLASLLQASSLVAIRKYGGPYSAVLLNLVPMSAGAVILLASGFVFETPANVHWSLLATASLLYLSVFATVTTFVLYYWLAKHVEAVVLSFSAFITPVIAVFTGWALLGESLTAAQLAGSVLVLLGIALATLVDRWKNASARSAQE